MLPFYFISHYLYNIYTFIHIPLYFISHYLLFSELTTRSQGFFYNKKGYWTEAPWDDSDQKDKDHSHANIIGPTTLDHHNFHVFEEYVPIIVSGQWGRFLVVKYIQLLSQTTTTKQNRKPKHFVLLLEKENIGKKKKEKTELKLIFLI